MPLKASQDSKISNNKSVSLDSGWLAPLEIDASIESLILAKSRIYGLPLLLLHGRHEGWSLSGPGGQ